MLLSPAVRDQARKRLVDLVCVCVCMCVCVCTVYVYCVVCVLCVYCVCVCVCVCVCTLVGESPGRMSTLQFEEYKENWFNVCGRSIDT